MMSRGKAQAENRKTSKAIWNGHAHNILFKGAKAGEPEWYLFSLWVTRRCVRRLVWCLLPLPSPPTPPPPLPLLPLPLPFPPSLPPFPAKDRNTYKHYEIIWKYVCIYMYRKWVLCFIFIFIKIIVRNIFWHNTYLEWFAPFESNFKYMSFVVISK